MLDNDQQFPPRMDIPAWYSDAPRPVPAMLDENEFDVDHGIECQLRGCLAPLALMVVLWAACAGLAFGETFALQPGNEQAQRPLGVAGSTRITEAAKSGAGIGFEMLCGSNESRFGGTWSQAMAKKAAIEKRAGKQASYLAVYRGDLGKAK